jgi:hypothetical protein
MQSLLYVRSCHHGYFTSGWLWLISAAPFLSIAFANLAQNVRFSMEAKNCSPLPARELLYKLLSTVKKVS